jgi:hypothetical protein
MRFRNQLLALVLPIAALARGAAADADKWMLTTADFHNELVEVRGLNASGVTVEDAATSQTRVVPVEQFLDLRRNGATTAVPAINQFVLYLTGGDKLIGTPANLTADSMIWKNSLLGDFPVPTASLRGVTRSATQSPAEQRFHSWHYRRRHQSNRVGPGQRR